MRRHYRRFPRLTIRSPRQCHASAKCTGNDSNTQYPHGHAIAILAGSIDHGRWCETTLLRSPNSSARKQNQISVFSSRFSDGFAAEEIDQFNNQNNDDGQFQEECPALIELIDHEAVEIF